MKTQADIVVEIMEMLGGVASLQELYDECAPRFPGARTPDATVRKLVQIDDRLSRLKPGLYCLRERADAIVSALERLGGVAAFEKLHEACEQAFHAEIKRLSVEAVLQIVQHDMRLHDFKDGRICLASRREELSILQPGSAKRITQADEVVAKIEALGGMATLEDVYAACRPLFVNWETKTPYDTVRRILSTDPRIRRLKPSLYCLNALADAIVHALEQAGGFAEIERLHEICDQHFQGGRMRPTVENVRRIARYDMRIHDSGDGRLRLHRMGAGGKTKTQGDVVVDALEQGDGMIALRDLYSACSPYFSDWGTKTPHATIRRIVQQDARVYKLKRGLYCLASRRGEFADMDDALLKSEPMYSERWEKNRPYYQMQILQLGRYKDLCTYAPPEDRDKSFLRSEEGLVNCPDLPAFAKPAIVDSAKLVDVVWLNEREMPCAFYEVAMTSDMGRSLEKLYYMQDFNADLVIVAPQSREGHFSQKTESGAFANLHGRVKFRSTDDIEQEVDREEQRFFW